jgi:hypothetical protein
MFKVFLLLAVIQDSNPAAFIFNGSPSVQVVEMPSLAVCESVASELRNQGGWKTQSFEKDIVTKWTISRYTKCIQVKGVQ